MTIRTVQLRAVLAVAACCALLWAGHTRYGPLTAPRLPGTPLAAPVWVKTERPGPATVVTGGRAWTTETGGTYLGLAEAGSDENRPFDGSGAPGLWSQISPDGRRLADLDVVVDLADPSRYEVWGAENDEYLRPQAWSPDGRYVAMLANLDRTVLGQDGRPGDRVLRVIDTRTGRASGDLAAIRWPQWPILGWAVAFSPDSEKIAFQDGDRIRIIDLDGKPVTDVPIPAGSRLAGKGAWTRDGDGLLVVSGERCDCGAYPVRWTLRTVSIGTGEVSGAGYQVDGAYAVRVLGWWRSSGQPVVAEYLPAAGTPVTFFTEPDAEDALVAMRDVASVRLLRLAPGAEPDILLQAAAQSIDVADYLINPIPPGGRPLADRHLVAAIGGALTLIALGVGAVPRRRRR
ncbi:hypothetical protein OHA21_20205 [Actinoplanes sp. NBC_00393]|uniref:hypothetical protein n=1 Tax=Actinoplanes sp. NBC_00393 TaxID=2975953 RepID=UPI002E1BB7A1